MRLMMVGFFSIVVEKELKQMHVKHYVASE